MVETGSSRYGRGYWFVTIGCCWKTFACSLIRCFRMGIEDARLSCVPQPVDFGHRTRGASNSQRSRGSYLNLRPKQAISCSQIFKSAHSIHSETASRPQVRIWQAIFVVDKKDDQRTHKTIRHDTNTWNRNAISVASGTHKQLRS